MYMSNTLYKTSGLAFLTLILSCGQPRPEGTAIVGIPADVPVFNPILQVGGTAATVLSFLFPELTAVEFDTAEGRAVYRPFLASRWESTPRSLTYTLRPAFWEDGESITAEDVRFSFRLYADPGIASPRRSSIRTLRLDSTKLPDIVVGNDSTVTFWFNEDSDEETQLRSTSLQIVPKHALHNLKASELSGSTFNLRPVTGRHFRFFNRVPGQTISLRRNEQWHYPRTAGLQTIIFRIIPDVNTRLVEFQQGALDFTEGLSVENVKTLGTGDFRIESQKSRRFDYVGWTHIDMDMYRKTGKRVPHRLFGDPRVRRALTMAIDRQSMVDAWLGDYGQQAIGPVSPAIRWAYNDTLAPLPYDQKSALAILREAGWSDHDGDGLLDKGGRIFEFTIVTNAGNARRDFVLENVIADLKKIGIRCSGQKMETNVYNNGLRNREFDAFIAGMAIAVWPDLSGQLGSDLEKNAFNVCAFSHTMIDSLLPIATGDRTGDTLRKIQAILHAEQPVTYLYWFDNLVAIQNRLENTHVDFLSAYSHHEMWTAD